MGNARRRRVRLPRTGTVLAELLVAMAAIVLLLGLLARAWSSLLETSAALGQRSLDSLRLHALVTELRRDREASLPPAEYIESGCAAAVAADRAAVRSGPYLGSSGVWVEHRWARGDKGWTWREMRAGLEAVVLRDLEVGLLHATEAAPSARHGFHALGGVGFDSGLGAAAAPGAGGVVWLRCHGSIDGRAAVALWWYPPSEIAAYPRRAPVADRIGSWFSVARPPAGWGEPRALLEVAGKPCSIELVTSAGVAAGLDL